MVGPLYMTTLRIFLIIVIIPLIIRLFLGYYGKILFTDIMFLLHVSWAAIAISVNNPDQMVQQVGSVGVEFLGGYILGRAYIRTAEDFIALCKVLAIIVSLSMPFAVVEAMSGDPLLISMIRKIPGFSSHGIISYETRLGLERVQFSFAHPIHYGLFCSVVFSLVYVALLGQLAPWRRLFASGLIALCVFLSLSSGAFFAIIIQIALIFWSFVFRKIGIRWWLLFGLFVCSYIAVDLLSNRTPIQVFMSYATFSAHTAYWRGLIFEWGIANVLGNVEKGVTGSPFFGIGLNDWVRPSFMHTSSMDNFWLVMAVRYGIFGFLTVAVGYAIGLLRVAQRDFQGDGRLNRLRLAWVFTFTGLSFTLATVHIWTNLYSFVFFMFGAGVWLINASPKQSKSDRLIPDVHSNDFPQAQVLTKGNQAKYSRFASRPISDRRIPSSSKKKGN